MSNHPPHSHNPKSAAADETPRQPTSDEKLKSFWLKNEKTVYAACLIVIIVVAAFGIFRNMQKDGDNKVGQEYAAANTPEKLRSFITAYPDHALAAAAQIHLADEAYVAKNYVEAAAAYDKAAAAKNSPFAGRAMIGAAMSKALVGQTADAESRLTQISNDATQPAGIRGEAAYHLATLAVSTGRTADGVKLYERVNTIAPASDWARAAAAQLEQLSVNTNTTVSAQPAATGSTGIPTIQFGQ